MEKWKGHLAKVAGIAAAVLASGAFSDNDLVVQGLTALLAIAAMFGIGKVQKSKAAKRAGLETAPPGSV